MVSRETHLNANSQASRGGCHNLRDIGSRPCHFSLEYRQWRRGESLDVLSQRGAKVREAVITKLNKWSVGYRPAINSLEHKHPGARKSHLQNSCLLRGGFVAEQMLQTCKMRIVDLLVMKGGESHDFL